MTTKQKCIVVLFLISFIIVNVVGVQVINAVMKQASNPYEGIVLVLDAGHGGKDWGAQFDNIKESELNLSVVKKLKQELEKVGIEVLLTRSDDRDLADPQARVRKREDLKRRVEIINQERVDVFVSVHMNSFADASVKGAQVFYAPQDEAGKLLAKYVQTRLSSVSKSSLKERRGEYYILREAKKAGILVECGFLSNEVESHRLTTSQYQQKVARSIKAGVLHFLEDIYE